MAKIPSNDLPEDRSQGKTICCVCVKETVPNHQIKFVLIYANEIFIRPNLKQEEFACCERSRNFHSDYGGAVPSCTIISFKIEFVHRLVFNPQLKTKHNSGVFESSQKHIPPTNPKLHLCSLVHEYFLYFCYQSHKMPGEHADNVAFTDHFVSGKKPQWLIHMRQLILNNRGSFHLCGNRGVQNVFKFQ